MQAHCKSIRAVSIVLESSLSLNGNLNPTKSDLARRATEDVSQGVPGIVFVVFLILLALFFLYVWWSIWLDKNKKVKRAKSN
jgi:hypothetical protein